MLCPYLGQRCISSYLSLLYHFLGTLITYIYHVTNHWLCTYLGHPCIPWDPDSLRVGTDCSPKLHS